MQAKHFGTFAALLLLLTLAVPNASRAAHAQKVFAGGGALITEPSTSSNFGGTRPTGLVGARLPYTDLFTLQGAVVYEDRISLEGTLQFHPFERVKAFGGERGVKPYAFGGVGYYVAGNDRGRRSVVPLGVGVEVPLRQNIGLNVEVGGRWAVGYNDPPRSFDVSPGLAPTVGLTYSFGSSGEEDTPPQRPPLAEESSGASASGEDDEAPAEETSVAEEAPTAQEASGEQGPAEQGPVGGDAAERNPVADESDTGASRRRDRVADTAPMPEGARRSGRPARQTPDAARLDTTEEGESQSEMRQVPAGTFVMGLTDEDPLDLQQAGRKRVSVTPFSIDKFEVSNAEYRTFLSELPPDQRQEMTPDSTIWEEARSRSTWEEYFRNSEFDDYPVVGVTHQQAKRYCQFNSKRLPTEAEWEYAARGDLVGSIYPWKGYEPRNNQGRYLANYNPDRGGYAADGYAFTAPGDAYPPTSWGLYHMSGNVAEWVRDKYHPSYSELSDFNPIYQDPEEDRYVVRGGSWASNAFYIGVGVRDSQPGDEASPYVGFRCVSDAGGSSN